MTSQEISKPLDLDQSFHTVSNFKGHSEPGTAWGNAVSKFLDFVKSYVIMCQVNIMPVRGLVMHNQEHNLAPQFNIR